MDHCDDCGFTNDLAADGDAGAAIVAGAGEVAALVEECSRTRAR